MERWGHDFIRQASRLALGEARCLREQVRLDLGGNFAGGGEEATHLGGHSVPDNIMHRGAVKSGKVGAWWQRVCCSEGKGSGSGGLSYWLKQNPAMSIFSLLTEALVPFPGPSHVQIIWSALES